MCPDRYSSDKQTFTNASNPILILNNTDMMPKGFKPTMAFLFNIHTIPGIIATNTRYRTLVLYLYI